MRASIVLLSFAGVGGVVLGAACGKGLGGSEGAGGGSASVAAQSSSAASATSTTGATMQKMCDPFKDGGCPKPEACDGAENGNFYCFSGMNTAKLCEPCDEKTGPFCEPGMSCQTLLATEAGVVHACSAFCCADDDCGDGGTCSFAILTDTHGVGICTDGSDASTPGPSCATPASPSDGGCYTP